MLKLIQIRETARFRKACHDMERTGVLHLPSSQMPSKREPSAENTVPWPCLAWCVYTCVRIGFYNEAR